MVQTYKFKFLNSTFFAFCKMDQGIITHTKCHRLNSILVIFLISYSFFNCPQWSDEFSGGKGRREISLTHKGFMFNFSFHSLLLPCKSGHYTLMNIKSTVFYLIPLSYYFPNGINYDMTRSRSSQPTWQHLTKLFPL